MLLWYGHPAASFYMMATRRYVPDDLEHRARNLVRAGHLIWLSVENERHVVTEDELPLACRLAASYHNQLAYNVPPDDGFDAETQRMEALAQLHMEAPSSDDDTENHCDTARFI